MSYEYNLFPQLDLQYPGSFFIYNYRDIEKWIISRINHKLIKNWNGKYIDACLQNLNYFYGYNFKTYEEICNHWRRYYYRHENMVKKYFKYKKNLLFLNLDDENSKSNLIVNIRNLGFEAILSELPHSK